MSLLSSKLVLDDSDFDQFLHEGKSEAPKTDEGHSDHSLGAGSATQKPHYTISEDRSDDRLDHESSRAWLEDEAEMTRRLARIRQAKEHVLKQTLEYHETSATDVHPLRLATPVHVMSRENEQLRHYPGHKRGEYGATTYPDASAQVRNLTSAYTSDSGCTNTGMNELQAGLPQMQRHGPKSPPPPVHIHMFHVLPRGNFVDSLSFTSEASSLDGFRQDRLRLDGDVDGDDGDDEDDDDDDDDDDDEDDDDDDDEDDDDIYDDGNLYKGRVYADSPQWEIYETNPYLRATIRVTDATTLARQNGAIFAVYNYYGGKKQARAAKRFAQVYSALPKPKPICHRIEVISRELKEAINIAFKGHPRLLGDLKDFEGKCWRSPFAWWHRNWESVDKQHLSERQLEVIDALTGWLDASYSSLYRKVDEQFHRGKVSSSSMRFLIQPGDVLLATNQDGLQQGYLAEGVLTPLGGSSGDRKWSVRSRSLTYAGDFFWEFADLEVNPRKDEKTRGELNISDLNVRPFRFSSADDQEKLRRRGVEFWGCRGKKLVSYDGSLKYGRHKGQRFMTDYKTYAAFHPKSFSYDTKQRVSPGLLVDEHAPSEPLIYLFPPRMPGFDLRYKKWIDLEVDQIREVEWKDNAFKNLVFDEDMKDLIYALVTNQVGSDKGTDLIDNKGNGLIMLLHGSPGTGKTYTAESVAEMARKPLYPVTCGDIGTEPHEVEKYLEQVFHLGKEWDCVVLLDEAEVFLEQRTLSDLKRNALVSVFLRALEYYEGILILTTNRVGTFDEAFKSRIQLAMRYEPLRPYQRKEIWRNFMKRLEEVGEEDKVNFDDITMNLDELANYDMNGRQIRNTITTARQLAKHKQRKMNSDHVRQAIKVADKFETYLASVRDGEMLGTKMQDRKPNKQVDEAYARNDYIR